MENYFFSVFKSCLNKLMQKFQHHFFSILNLLFKANLKALSLSSVLYPVKLDQYCFLGLLNVGECKKLPCSSTQDPLADQCLPNDGYQRSLLFRSWNTSCPPIYPDFSKNFTYAWDYSGTWNWGSNATVRCLPGFVLPDDQAKVSGFFWNLSI